MPRFCNVEFTNMANTIHHTGIIERKEADKVYVRITQQSACAGCHAKSMCNASESKDHLIEVEGAYDSFQINEEVELLGQSSFGLQAVGFAFVLPLLFLFTVIVFCLEMKQSETVSALIGLAVLPLYYSVLYFFRDKLKKKFVFAMKKLN